MSDMNRHERLNEDQCHFFGFSPMALGDEIFNGLVDSWEKQVDYLLEQPQWSKLKRNKIVKAALINLIFEKGSYESLHEMSNKLSEYAHLEVFSIPDTVVLPGTEPLQQMGSVDPTALRRRVADAERRAEEAKKRAALLRHEKEDVRQRLEIIRGIARKLGYVKKNGEISGETGSYMEENSMAEESTFHDESKENGEGDRDTVDEKMEDTVSKKEMEVEDESTGDKTMTEEGMEEMMERSLITED
ncbi:hypothetical protein PENTCL1PPCAC_1978 [Pristionchus entomophagus]|uniref:Uncharacterized protein n=1 Tax=Pristionchus entomophagus TaxID=358040 RepID=A0AAV5SA52_9BILA|nr:hypothetical protein PENTCL1PPCAC_1978 [Pristionchus entomophagus]